MASRSYTMILTLPKDIYPKIAVMKAAYHFTDTTYIYINQSDDAYIVDITAKEGCSVFSEQEFKNELLAQALRCEIDKQTGDIRHLITMRALASTIVGEQAEIIQPPLNYSEDSILKDWFEANDKENL